MRLTTKSSIYLRAPGAQDRRAFLAAVRISAQLHRPWINAPATTLGFHAYLKKMAEPANRAYLICRQDTDYWRRWAPTVRPSLGSSAGGCWIYSCCR